MPERRQPWEQPARRLPVTLQPVHRETVGSYLARLAQANSIQGLALARCLAPYQRMPTTVEDDTRHWSATTIQRLAVIAGQPLSSLRRALPGLTQPPPLQLAARRRALRAVLRACQRCMAARGITTAVFVHGHPHEHVCVRHQRWLRAMVHVDLTGLPEVLAAQQRHARLVRRRLQDQLDAAFVEAAEVVGAWYEAGWHPSLSERWRARLRILGEDTTTRISQRDTASAQLATYPEAVALAGLLASPYWQSNILARTQTARFYQEAGRRLGLTYPNTGRSDPLALWARRLRRRHGAAQRERERRERRRREREGASGLEPA